MSTGIPNPPNPGDRRPSDGRMNAVLATLKDALRPGDMRHQQNRQERTLKQHNPADSSVEAQHNVPPTQRAQQEPGSTDSLQNQRQTPPHAPAFPEAHRDASGHTAVSESIMPGNQGRLSGSAADQYPERKQRRGSGILGVLSNMRRRNSAGSEGSAARDELGRRTSAGGGDYTYDALSGIRSQGKEESGDAARPRTTAAGSNGAMRDHVAAMAGADETLQAAAGKVPPMAGGGKERDVHDPVWRRL